MRSLFTSADKLFSIVLYTIRSIIEFLLGLPSDIWALSRVSLLPVPIPIISKPGRQQRRCDCGQGRGRSHQTFSNIPTQATAGHLRLMPGPRSSTS